MSSLVNVAVEHELKMLLGLILPSTDDYILKHLPLYCYKCINCQKKDQVVFFGCLYNIEKSGSSFGKNKHIMHAVELLNRK